MTAHIQSRIIIGARASVKTELALRKATGQKGEIGFCVFETHVGRKRIYCCWSGGTLNHETGEPSLTPTGIGAMEALCSLPFKKSILIFAEVKIGKTPLQDKIKQIILDAPDDAFICFVGDLAKELDGKMGPAFNPTGAPLIL